MKPINEIKTDAFREFLIRFGKYKIGAIHFLPLRFVHII